MLICWLFGHCFGLLPESTILFCGRCAKVVKLNINRPQPTNRDEALTLRSGHTTKGE